MRCAGVKVVTSYDPEYFEILINEVLDTGRWYILGSGYSDRYWCILGKETK